MHLVDRPLDAQPAPEPHTMHAGQQFPWGFQAHQQGAVFISTQDLQAVRPQPARMATMMQCFLSSLLTICISGRAAVSRRGGRGRGCARSRAHDDRAHRPTPRF